MLKQQVLMCQLTVHQFSGTQRGEHGKHPKHSQSHLKYSQSQVFSTVILSAIVLGRSEAQKGPVKPMKVRKALSEVRNTGYCPSPASDNTPASSATSQDKPKQKCRIRVQSEVKMALYCLLSLFPETIMAYYLAHSTLQSQASRPDSEGKNPERGNLSAHSTLLKVCVEE